MRPSGPPCAVLGALLLALGACAGTARVPEPLALPPSIAAPAAGSASAEATVRRNGGPVRVVRPEAPAGFALTFFRNRQRVGAGWGVEVGRGGRAEVTWTERDATLSLSDGGRVVLGDPARGEPLARLVDVTLARVRLPPGERVGLPGGGELLGDPEEPSGPFRCELLRDGVLRVKNESLGKGTVRFGEAELALLPLEALDLPGGIAGAGAEVASPIEALELAGARIRIFGGLRATAGPEGLRVAADGPGLVQGLGVRIHLAPGEELALLPAGGPGASMRPVREVSVP